MNPLVDHRIGAYRVLDQVGHGSMADVYRASHVESGALVALKVPHHGDGFWEAERYGARIQQALHQMDPRVPRVDEIRDEPALRYIAMEFVEGEDLSRKLERGRLPWRDASAIARQLLGVLTSARLCPADEVRRGGIVHGDIKPSNVRVMVSGEVRLLDFGIAKSLLETGQGTINRFQSLAYCSPERLADTKVNVHADLWAVAVVFYEMLAGTRPFRAPTPEDLYERIRSGLARAAPLDAGVPPRLAAVVEMGLDPVIDRRYQSAEEFENDLVAAVDDRPTLAERRFELRRLEESTRRSEAVAPVFNGAAANGVATTRSGEVVGDGAATTRGGEVAANGVATSRGAEAPANGAARLGGAAGPALGDRAHDSEATRPTGAPSARASGAPTARDAAPVPAARAVGWPARPAFLRARPPLKAVLVLILVVVLANEFWALTSLGELQSQLPGLARADADAVWKRYRRLKRRSVVLGMGAPLFAGGIRDWMLANADDLISRFRLDGAAIRENGWLKARTLLEHAASFSPTDRQILARIDYCNGQIARIGSGAAQNRQVGRQLSDDALTHFQNAARRWPRWPDPHLGLAAVYAYNRREPENAEAAIARASETGYEVGERETALLGDAYRLRAESMWSRSTSGFTPQRRHDQLVRIRADYSRALDYYERAPDFGLVPDHLSGVQSRLDQLDRRIEALIGDAVETAQ